MRTLAGSLDLIVAGRGVADLLMQRFRVVEMEQLRAKAESALPSADPPLLHSVQEQGQEQLRTKAESALPSADAPPSFRTRASARAVENQGRKRTPISRPASSIPYKSKGKSS